MARRLRVSLLRILVVLLLLELGLRVEWAVRDHWVKPTAREGAVHLLAFGNSLTAGYPRFLQAAIADRLPDADAVIEQLVIGATPSNQLIRSLETRLLEGPIDVVIAMIGAYDRRTGDASSDDSASPDLATVEVSALYSLKPMFIGVLRGALESWRDELQQRGLHGLLSPDDRAAAPVFQRGTERATAGDTERDAKHAALTASPSLPAAPLSPESVVPDWGARAESRRVVASGDIEAVASGFARVLSLGWGELPSNKKFRAAKKWYVVISSESPEFMEDLRVRMQARYAPGAEPLLQFALAFRRGDYKKALRLGRGLPDRWFTSLSLVHAARASRGDFERILAATLQSRGADTHAARMQIDNLTEHDATDELVGFLARILQGLWPEAGTPAKDGPKLERLARAQLSKLLAARAECARARMLGLPGSLEDRVHGDCLEKQSATSQAADFYTEVSRRSYRRLLELGRTHGFAVVAVQYPGRPIEELASNLPTDEDVPLVDNDASFAAAVEEHTYLGVYAKYGAVGRGGGGHLTARGDRLLAKNIFEVLLAEGLLPSAP